ncbi:MAG: DNA mismatch repair protein MutS [Chitinophagaceae bacterium]|nr:DNA mismatch repair protein MutS [Chitinophagaceae bacterium]
MDIDKQSFNDISVFHREEEYSVFHKLDFTRTLRGKEWLKKFFNEPFHQISHIQSTQKMIQTLALHIDEWPAEISNGTLLMIEKFYDYIFDPISESPYSLTNLTYPWLHREDYSMLKFSLTHFADFYRGMKKICELLKNAELPEGAAVYVDRIVSILKETPIRKLAETQPGEKLTRRQLLYFGYYLRGLYKTNTLELLEIYGRLDAWYSMAKAVKTYRLAFPEFIDRSRPEILTEGLYHLLLPEPVSYDLHLSATQNFLFLTGANMSGKSTLIKALGTAVFLAHIGMGVPARFMKLTLFDGMVTNIHVEDNIAKGESYFYNEVQRIKNTVLKINDGRKWLVLIDELFKGTNVQDAMKCSLAVIKGLIKIPNSLFVLSTHLYEIADNLKKYPNILFRFFETLLQDDQLSFTYQLKEGISNDRIGYVILKKEKVIDLLENL